jgi:probable rRNA maturation factor
MRDLSSDDDIGMTVRSPRRRARSRALAIDVVEPCNAWATALPQAAELCRSAARATLAAAPPLPGAGDAELSLVLADDALLRRLNRTWRGKDKATNVLSFPAQDFAAGAGAAPAEAPLLLGDVVLGFSTVRREAEAQKKPLADHLAHLVVHGVLHLLGFDHASEDDAARMETMERDVLAGIGIADPYEPRPAAPRRSPLARRRDG